MQSTFGKQVKNLPWNTSSVPGSRSVGGRTGKVKPVIIDTGHEIAQTDFQHDRGERSARAGLSPFPQGKEQSGVTRVFVLSKDGTPLMLCHAARARELLAKGKAVVVRRIPFVTRLKHNSEELGTQPVAFPL